jgi:hypothetical protein
MVWPSEDWLMRIYDIVIQHQEPGLRILNELKTIWHAENCSLEKVKHLHDKHDVRPLQRLRFTKGIKLLRAADWIRCEAKYEGRER